PSSRIWYLFGLQSGTTCVRTIFTGQNPAVFNVFSTPVAVPSLPLKLLNIRLNPVDGKYYAIGNRIGAANNYTLQIFSCLATNIAADIWSQQTPGSTTGHIWADIGVPTGFDVATINASLDFIWVRAFALFTG